METRLIARIDCGRLADNWHALARLSGAAAAGAVVKADGYGHGVKAVAQTLYAAGCRFFFTASFAEAVELRAILPNTKVGVFDSLTPQDREAVLHHAILPSINSGACLAVLADWAADLGESIPAMLAVDTGMNRLGIAPDTLPQMIESPLFRAGDWQLVFSHLACADEPSNPKNAEQKTAFDALCATLPNIPKSLAASAGIMLGGGFHYDLTRPGIALYGACPVPELAPHIKPVLSLHALVLQIRHAPAGETIGYNATARLTRPSRLATIAGGYADGISRALSNRGQVHFRGLTAPMLGRISMDTTVIDITDWPQNHIGLGDFVDLLHDGYTADAMARDCGTIAYEILTGLHGRITRRYIGRE